MDDECSVLSSCYWDATSITSDATIPAEFYHTPTGSIMDICQCDNYNSEKDDQSLTTSLNDMKIVGNNIKEVEIEPIQTELVRMENNTTECSPSCKQIPSRPPPIKLSKSMINENTDAIDGKSPKKKNWKQILVRRLSFNRFRKIKSFSMSKNDVRSKSTRSIFQSMRHSIRRIRSFDKKSRSSKNDVENKTESASVVLGSDCEYFTFTKVDNEDTQDQQLSIELEDYENTPLKPRRKFTQEKYVTGSKEILKMNQILITRCEIKKAFNSLKRKSHLHDDKSLFDICSTVSYVFINELKDEICVPNNEKLKYRNLIDGCVNAFLDVHKIQTEKSLLSINKTIGAHIDLYSKDLDIINKSKKYQITELFGSNGVCVITNTTSQKQFIALKTSCPKSWIICSGFLQHIEKDVNIRPGQEWICFPAQSITNLYIEKNLFSSIREECKLLLDSLIQLIVILYCQKMNNFNIKINPSNVLLISSDLSIICVFVESTEGNPADDDVEWLNDGDNDDKEIIHTYQNSIMKLNKYVDGFLSLPDNLSHLITASYPLDYLFFLLLKLHKDINILLNSIEG